MSAVRLMPCGFLVVGDTIADDLDVRISRDPVLETLVAGIEGFMARHGGEEPTLPAALPVRSLMHCAMAIGRRLAARFVVGGKEGGIFVGLCAGVDDDHGNTRVA